MLQAAKAAAAYSEFRIHDALEAALAISNRGNQYMEEVAPWTAFKKVSADVPLHFFAQANLRRAGARVPVLQDCFPPMLTCQQSLDILHGAAEVCAALGQLS